MKPNNAGFAIGSPSSPWRLSATSDQIKASWVNASKLQYQSLTLLVFVSYHRDGHNRVVKVVAIGRRMLQFTEPVNCLL